jgi:hypothetical protein
MLAPKKHVFINCPFDREYAELFHSLVFGLISLGFKPRCSLERSDAGDIRIEKILAIMEECPLAVHDISRVELDGKHRLPRFNMPFELGLWFGRRRQRRKSISTLILEAKPFQYQKYLSDISGQDTKAHSRKPEVLILHLRDWLQTLYPDTALPGGKMIAHDFRAFARALPAMAAQLGQKPVDLLFADLVRFVVDWLTLHPRRPAAQP